MPAPSQLPLEAFRCVYSGLSAAPFTCSISIRVGVMDNMRSAREVQEGIMMTTPLLRSRNCDTAAAWMHVEGVLQHRPPKRWTTTTTTAATATAAATATHVNLGHDGEGGLEAGAGELLDLRVAAGLLAAELQDDGGK